tara:strand:+ start:523 stop:1062 length:540 start_codon:yes stop_codon:yes gene_type:complete
MPLYTNTSAGTVTYSTGTWQTAGLILEDYIIDSADTGNNKPAGTTDVNPGTVYRAPLSFTLGANQRCRIHGFLDATWLAGDLKYKLTTPANTVSSRIIVRASETPISNPTSEVTNLYTNTAGVSEVEVNVGDGTGYWFFEGTIKAGSTSGDVAIQAAQRDNNANDTVLKEGSFLQYLIF